MLIKKLKQYFFFPYIKLSKNIASQIQKYVWNFRTEISWVKIKSLYFYIPNDAMGSVIYPIISSRNMNLIKMLIFSGVGFY